jgi:hypothetical protein
MGWVNYIVIDSWKTKIVVSRNTSMDSLEEVKKQLDNIQNVYEDLPETAFETKQKDVTITEYSDYVQLAYSAYLLMLYGETNLDDYFFMIWLSNRNISFRLISEFELAEDEGKNYETIEFQEE